MRIGAKLTLISLGIAFLFDAHLAFADNLLEAVQQTIAFHPQVLSAEDTRDATKSDVRQQQGAYFPTFNVALGYGWENSDNPATRAAGDGDITLFRQESAFIIQQLLFDGGNVSNRVAKSKADYQTASFQWYEARELLALAASQAYLSVMRDRMLVDIAELNVQAHAITYEKITKRVQAGAGLRSDQELAQSRLALAKANYELAKGTLADSEATYIKVVGHPAAGWLPLPPQPRNIPLNLPEAQALAISFNPTLAASKAQIAANIAAVGVAKSTFFPTITLDVKASYNDSLDGVPGYSNTKQAMLRMNYNLFNGGSDKASVEAAKYRQVSSVQDTQKIQREILENVAFAWDGMQTAQQRIPNLDSHTVDSFNVWQAYIEQFKLGQRTLFDVLNSQSEFYDAKSALVQAQFEERIDRYRLLASMGELVATINDPNFNRLPIGYVGTASPLKSALKTAALNDATLPPADTTTPIATPGGAASPTKAWSYPAANTSAPVPTTSTPVPTNSPSTPAPAIVPKGEMSPVPLNHPITPPAAQPATAPAASPAVPAVPPNDAHNITTPEPALAPITPHPASTPVSGSSAAKSTQIAPKHTVMAAGKPVHKINTTKHHVAQKKVAVKRHHKVYAKAKAKHHVAQHATKKTTLASAKTVKKHTVVVATKKPATHHTEHTAKAAEHLPTTA